MRRNWRSAFEILLGSGQQDSIRSAEPAEPTTRADAADGATRLCPGASWETPDLLLMRMEALRLDPAEVKAFMPTEFRVLARVCDHCQDRVRCERDLIYEAAGQAVSWERYCPNAPRLGALGSAPPG
jgi:hypothetical protein